MGQAADRLKTLGRRKLRKKAFQEIRALKGYCIYMGIQSTVCMLRAKHWFREDLSGLVPFSDLCAPYKKEVSVKVEL